MDERQIHRFFCPALRDERCKKSSQEFFSGNWREEHLFNLKSALPLYDMTQREIAAYEARILDEIRCAPNCGALPGST